MFFVGKRFMPGDVYYVAGGPLHSAGPSAPDGIMDALEACRDARLPQPQTFVVVGDVLADIRTRARAAGTDLLDAPFFPPIDHPDQARLKELLAGIEEGSALGKQMAAAAPTPAGLTRRRAIAVGERVEQAWM